MAPSINLACLDLTERGMVHTVSVCVNRPFFHYRLADLVDLQRSGKLMVAVHLDISHPRCFLPWHSLWIPTTELKKELEGQRDAVLNAGLRLDSVNGHRHIHLYPGPLSLVRKWGLPLRLPSDRSHPPSYIGGYLAELFCKAKWRKAGYLNIGDLRSVKTFSRKLSLFPELLCHPASVNDFSRCAFSDSLREERVLEYQSICRLAGEMDDGAQ